MQSTSSKTLLTGAFVAIFGATLLLAQIPVPYTFTAGTVIDPDQMNTNFSTLGNAALNRNGGTMTGTLLVPAGTAALPGLAGSAQSSTGVRLTTNALGLSVAGTERLSLTTTDYALFGTSLAGNATQVSLLNGSLIVGASGASFYGNGLVNNTGKIPAVTSAYFTDATLAAANLTGTVPPARLGSGSPNNQSFLRGDSVWANVQTVYFFTPVTTTYTALVSDSVITANGTFTITLYACSGNSGRWLEIKNTGTGTVTVNSGGANIDGAATFALVVQYQAITIACDGATWHIL